jgi:hypothetical protein
VPRGAPWHGFRLHPFTDPSASWLPVRCRYGHPVGVASRSSVQPFALGKLRVRASDQPMHFQKKMP